MSDVILTVDPPRYVLTPEQEQALYENCKAMSAYTSLIVEATNLLNSVMEESTNEELQSVQNRILCGDSFKAAFFGCINAEPTTTIEELKLRETTKNGAVMLDARRWDIRTKALNLVK